MNTKSESEQHKLHIKKQIMDTIHESQNRSESSLMYDSIATSFRSLIDYFSQPSAEKDIIFIDATGKRHKTFFFE